jgi:DNA-3-methyladenine glycosylase II
MRPIANAGHLSDDLAKLLGADPRLRPIAATAGEIPLRLAKPGFASLAAIIVGQQVSRASAEAMLSRLKLMVDPLTPQDWLAAGESVWRHAGLSRAKQKAITALAEAVGRDLDLDALCRLEAEAAIERLTALPGIGRWTAEVYLLVAAGHPDIFPARDVALQTSVGQAFSIVPRPGEREVARIAESWSPWRAAAARLFWAYYRQILGREAAPPMQPGSPS